MNNNPYGLAALWTKGDLLIKSVAVLLLLSITSWYVIATRACRAIGLRRPARAVDHHATNKEDLHGQLSLAEWLTESLRGAIDDSAERMGSGLAILASVGSTAPFVGLFGTVWGIYHALVGSASAARPASTRWPARWARR